MCELILVICLSITTLLTGCQTSVNANNEVVMGRYLEEIIEFEGLDADGMPEMCFFENAQGGIEAISCHAENTESACKCYIPGDNKVWKETDEVLSNNINKEKLYTLDSIQKDKLTGDLYVIGEKLSGAKIKLKTGAELDVVTPYIARIKEDSTLEEITIDWKVKEAYFYEIKVAQDKVFIIPDDLREGSSAVIQQYDLKTGKFTWELKKEIGEFTIVGSYMYTFDWEDRDAIKCYDINTSKEIMNVNIENAYGMMVPAENEKGIYLVDEDIYYLAQNEALVEKILDGERYSLSLPSNCIVDAMIKDGTFYLTCINDSSYVCRQYTYHDDIPLEPEEKVTIFSLEDCPSLRRAGQIYMDKHPEVFVDINVVSTDGEVMEREVKNEAIEEINTQILAGIAADIIVLDGLPVEDYIEKGILGDMSSIAEEMQKDNNGYACMLNAYKEDEKLYALPLSFSIVSAVGEREVLKDGFSLEALAAYQKAHPEKQVLANMVPEELIERMSGIWQSRMIDTEEKVSTSELIKFLEAVNTLAPMKEGMTDCYNDKSCFSGSRAFQAEDKKIRVILEEACDGNQLQVLLHGKNQLDDAIIADKIEGQENLVKLNQLIGINAASDKQEIIHEILMIAFSKEIANKEETRLNYGISVHQNIAEEVLLGEDELWAASDNSGKMITSKDILASFMGYREGKEEAEIKNIPTWYTEDVMYYIEHLKNATVVYPMDYKILTIIQQESEDYFKGSISANEAAEHIKAKIDLYLSEQNK